MDSALALGLAANGIALAAVIAGWRQNHDTLTNQRRIADLDDVRDRLDEGAVALHDGAYVLDEVRSQATQHSPSFFKSERGTEVYGDLAKHGRDLDALVERLRVRFGRNHAVVAAFKRADAAFLDIYRAAGLIRLEPDSDGSPAARHQIDRLHDQTRSRLDEQRTRFDEARDDFIDAASDTAGADLTT